MAKVKTPGNINLGEDVEKWELPTLLEGVLY